MIKIINESIEDDFDDFDFGDNDAGWYEGGKNIPKECVKGATLLSKEEYNKYKNNIPKADRYWWLRTAGNCYYNACSACGNSGVDACCAVDSTYSDIRPALILNLQFSNLSFGVGDKIDFGGHLFTIISNELAICDGFICKGCFRDDWKAPDANVYEKSDIKKVVDNWFNNAMRSE